MTRGIEAAANGMIGITYLNDIIANNLANINTAGFKQTLVTFKNQKDLEVSQIDAAKGYQDSSKSPGTLSIGSVMDSTMIDFKQGSIKVTGNPLDVAINGDGFFVVQTPDGEAYTRNGSFTRNQEGLITTLEGYPLLGESGSPVSVNVNNFDIKKLKISENGNIEVNKESVDKVKIVDFEDRKDLIAVGNSLFKSVSDQKPVDLENFNISQGSVELSNSNTVEALIKSIEGMRTYETLTKTIESNHRTLGKTVNEVGRVKR